MTADAWSALTWPRRGATLVALAALCWGLAGGVGGLLMALGYDALVLALYRAVLGLMVVWLWLAMVPGRSGLGQWRLWAWSLLAGAGVAGNFGFYFLSIASGHVSVAVTLMYSAPVFVFLISAALRLESLTPLKWTAMVTVMVGLLLLSQAHDLGAEGVAPMAVATGLMAGVSYAVFIFGFKYAAAHGSPQAILSVAFIVPVVVLMAVVDVDQALASLSSEYWLWFVVLGVLGAGLSFVIYVVGLRYTNPSVASVVAMIEPVTASGFGIVVLGEVMRASQWLGVALILVAVTVLGSARRVPR